jgi:hypothetical protein
MQAALDLFHESLSRVEHLGGLYNALSSLTTPVLDASDLLRAQIVLGVSALDYYVHELTVLGMVEIFEGKRPPTDAYTKYRVSIGTLSAANPVAQSSWLEGEVRERHSFLSFQQPDKVADAVRLFSAAKLWEGVSAQLHSNIKTTTDRLKLIVDRRNKIAHEADLDPSYPGARWPIHESDVTSSLHFIRSICDGIHKVVA